jgi:uncharacterized membrane protein
MAPRALWSAPVGDDLLEWAAIALRWVHIFAAILWVGTTYLFNFMDKSLVHEAGAASHVRGRLWMVHGGGFWLCEKHAPDDKPRTLHWFKWEAATTWLSGMLLLALAYYHGGLLVEPDQSFARGALAGVAAIVLGWVVYDLLVRSPLGRKEGVLAALGWLAIVAVAYVLRRHLAPRAVFMHVGAMLGTIMAANVWMRILPSQRRMLAAVAAGRAPDEAVSATGPLRSKQNSYLAIPLVFLMASNHAPLILGSDRAWLSVGATMLVGWAVARWLRGPTRPGEGAPVAASGEYRPWRAALALALFAGGLFLALR